MKLWLFHHSCYDNAAFIAHKSQFKLLKSLTVGITQNNEGHLQ